MASNLDSKEPGEVPESAVHSNCLEMRFDRQNIASLPDDLCERFSHLTILSANNNVLETLPSNIHHLSKLSELYLVENSLCFLPEDVTKLKCLKKLHISSNFIKEIPKDIHLMDSLTELFADENEIKTLPPSFGNLKNLSNLNLSSNAIECLPNSFGDMLNLKELDLSHNCLTCLPHSFQYLPSLESINLNNNRISVLPDEFLSAKILKKFLMNENLLEEIPAWFSDLENIKEIFLTDNKLQMYSVEWGMKSEHMEQSELSQNAIPSLTAGFDVSKNVHVDCNKNGYVSFQNHLKLMPRSFCSLKTLSKLILEGNQIRQLPGSFGFLSGLEYLDLSRNQLKYLPNSFGELRRLQVCILGMNYLKQLPTSFGFLAALEVLQLNKNLLEYLPESFENLSSLISLDLYGNLLKEIPQVLNSLKKLKFLDLRENGFKITVENASDTKTTVKTSDDDDEKEGIGENSKNFILYKAMEAASLWKRDRKSGKFRKSLCGTDAPVPYGFDYDSGDSFDNFVEDQDDDSEEKVEFITTADENWELDFNPDAFRRHSNCVGYGDYEEESSSDWDSGSEDLPNNFSKIYRHPVSNEPSHFNMKFVPSDFHVKPVQAAEDWCVAEEGQFDDA